MLLCQAAQRCDGAPYERALRRAAPDNALGWAGEVSRASRSEDQEGISKRTGCDGASQTFDLYWNANIVAMTSQMRSALVAPPDNHGSGPPISAEIVAIGAIAAMPIPAYQPITKFCKSMTDETGLLECHQIALQCERVTRYSPT